MKAGKMNRYYSFSRLTSIRMTLLHWLRIGFTDVPKDSSGCLTTSTKYKKRECRCCSFLCPKKGEILSCKCIVTWDNLGHIASSTGWCGIPIFLYEYLLVCEWSLRGFACLTRNRSLRAYFMTTPFRHSLFNQFQIRSADNDRGQPEFGESNKYSLFRNRHFGDEDCDHSLFKSSYPYTYFFVPLTQENATVAAAAAAITAAAATALSHQMRLIAFCGWRRERSDIRNFFSV